MALYSRDGEIASIMALAPVIPVLTVQSVEDGRRAGESPGRRRPFRDRGDAADAERARGDQGDRAGMSRMRSSGAGTIVSVEQIDEAVAAGARFLVSPGATPELASGGGAARPSRSCRAAPPSPRR